MSFKSFKPNQCRSAFREKGFVEKVSGKDHYYYTLFVNGQKTNIFTKVSHTNKKSIGKALFAKIARDLGVPSSFLREFIKCDKEHHHLVELLVAEGII